MIPDVSVYPVMQLDSLAVSHPIYVRVQKPDEISAVFDDITYMKVRFHKPYLSAYKGTRYYMSVNHPVLARIPHW